MIKALTDEVASQAGGNVETNMVVTNERHKNCLIKSRNALKTVISTSQLPPEIIAEEVRTALRALEELVGKTTTEDILGRVFSKFCIGK